MSREPQSAAHRYSEALGRSGAPREAKPAPPPEPPTKPQPGKGKRIRVRVEAAKKRDPYRTRWKDLTPEEMTSFRIHPKDDA